MSRKSIVVLIYHYRKFLDLIPNTQFYPRSSSVLSSSISLNILFIKV
jgi:hypothetical protein